MVKASNLVEILKEDTKLLGKALCLMLEPPIRGVIRGLYTPFFLWPAVKNPVDELYDCDSGLGDGVKLWTQVVSAGYVYWKIANYAINNDKNLECWGAMAATNGLYYIGSVFKRAKEKETKAKVQQPF